MRVCVIGAGIAGTFLAWRLGYRPGVSVDLVTGPPGDDATAVSCGGVRAFATHPEQRRLAIESLAELLESPALLEQAAYSETGSTYLLAGSSGVEAAVSEVEHVHPDSVELVDGATLRRDRPGNGRPLRLPGLGHPDPRQPPNPRRGLPASSRHGASHPHRHP
jgi:glycine/D-amino acid oxidase-like deaminating enzyme